MMRAVIIDDEPNNIDTLQQLLARYCPGVIIAGTANNTKTGQLIIETVKPDLVFLDVEMPFGNASDLLSLIKPIRFEIIFITAFDNYAIKAIQYSALAYLLKPVSIPELQQAVQKAMEVIETKNINNKIENLLYNLQVSKTSLQKMALPTMDGLVFADIKNFVCLQAKGNYTEISLVDGNTVFISRPLKYFEEMLPEENFSRVHQSYIVNHSFIKKYHKGRGGYIEMDNGLTIDVAIRKKDEFLAKFK